MHPVLATASWTSITRQAENMTPQEHDELSQVLKTRFEKHGHRHAGVTWADVRARLDKHTAALPSLRAMQATGGEPDVVAQHGTTGQITFCDCAAESPLGRRSLCYDGEALASRKENKPAGSALDMAQTMGIELLTQAGYRELQTLGDFDMKTSSWIATPAGIRTLGGALFCDRRYGEVFVYHNGAQSYYAARGFRGRLVI
jgi:hypothetical protein